MDEQNLEVIFKATHNAEMRRLSFDKLSDVTYDELYSRLSSLFKLPLFKIRYTDEDGDAICISNNSDLKDAFDHLSSVNDKKQKLTVRLLLEKLEYEQKTTEKELPNTPFETIETKMGQPNIPFETIETKMDETLSIGNTPSSVSISSLDSAAQSLLLNTETNSEFNEQDDYPFDKAINNGIKNLQEMVQDFVTQLSNTVEKDLSNGLSNLNLFNLSQQSVPQQTNDFQSQARSESNELSEPNESVTGSSQMISAASNETRQVPVSSTPLEPVVHDHVMCDCCHIIIHGMRWKCTACPDYDLCQACKSKSPSVHRHPDSHAFRPIPYPSHTNRAPPVSNLHSAICDYCESVIFGIRHKCINCPDFDLCNNCIELAPTQHPNHTFMPIHRPGKPEIKIPDAVHHPGVRCDGCSKAINGIRYKCGNCADFDLCGNCEAAPLSKHDLNHVFIKIRRPVTAVMTNQESLLPSFYTRIETKITRPNSCRRVSPQPMRMHEAMAALQTSRGSSNQSSPQITQKKIDLDTEQSTNQTSPKSEPIESRAPIALYEKMPVLASPPVVRTPSVHSCASTTSSDKVEETKTTSALRARFIEDVNVPDGTVLPSQAQFLKIWKMENNSEIDWPETTALQFIGGQWMFNEILREQTAPQFPVGKVEIGKTIPVTADLQAPANPGRYVSYWRLTDGENMFGDKVWVEIIVESAVTSSSLSSSMVFPRMDYEQFPSSTPSVVPESQIETSENEQNEQDEKIIAEQMEKTEQIEDPSKDPDLESTTSLSESSFSEADSEFIVVDSLEHQTPDNAPSTTCNVEVVSETASQHSAHSAQEFVKELQKLKDMGFGDEEKNLEALVNTGSLDSAIDALVK